MTVSAVRPWRNALRHERSLPSGVVGPVLLSALRRLASICLSELIDDQQENWVRFVRGICPHCDWHFSDWPQSVFASPSVFRRGLLGIFIGMDICRRRFWVRLLPMPLGNLQGIDFQTLPPGHFIAGLMQLPMMTAAERHGELVADFETERSGLGKPQMMRIGRLTAANEAGLRGHEPQMGFVAKTLGLGDGEKALIDLRWDEAGCGRDDNRAAGGRADFQFTSSLRPIPGDQILATAIVTGRPWNRGRIVRMEADAGIGRQGDSNPRDSSL